MSTYGRRSHVSVVYRRDDRVDAAADKAAVVEPGRRLGDDVGDDARC